MRDRRRLPFCGAGLRAWSVLAIQALNKLKNYRWDYLIVLGLEFAAA